MAGLLPGPFYCLQQKDMILGKQIVNVVWPKNRSATKYKIVAKIYNIKPIRSW